MNRTTATRTNAPTDFLVGTLVLAQFFCRLNVSELDELRDCEWRQLWQPFSALMWIVSRLNRFQIPLIGVRSDRRNPIVFHSKSHRGTFETKRDRIAWRWIKRMRLRQISALTLLSCNTDTHRHRLFSGLAALIAYCLLPISVVEDQQHVVRQLWRHCHGKWLSRMFSSRYVRSYLLCHGPTCGCLCCFVFCFLFFWYFFYPFVFLHPWLF